MVTLTYWGVSSYGQSIIESVEQTNGVAIVLLGRAYHNDPGINHGILDQLQQRGYPILTQDALSLHHEATRQLFPYSGDKDH